MSSSTRAILIGSPGAGEIAAVLRRRYGAAATIHATSRPDHKLLHFSEPHGSGRSRCLHIFLDGFCREDYADLHDGDATYVSMGGGGDGPAITLLLAEHFGGLHSPTNLMDPTPWQRLPGASGHAKAAMTREILGEVAAETAATPSPAGIPAAGATS